MPLQKRQQIHGSYNRARGLSPQLRAMRLAYATLGRVLPRVMGRQAYRLWFRTRRFPESAAGKRFTAAAERDTLMVNDIPVAMYSLGEGPTVLFVHGWSGRGSQVAAFAGPLRAAGYRVLAVDAPGHGNTPGDRTNIMECNAVLQAIFDRYGLLHGAITHSFGGMVLAYAMKLGLPVDRAVMISTPAHFDYLMQSFTETLAMPDGVIRDLQRRMDARFEEGFRETTSTVVNVSELQVPGLVIHDEDDVNVPWEQGKIIANAWPGAQFMKTSGLGHGRILRDPGVVDAAVSFIGRQD